MMIAFTYLPSLVTVVFRGMPTVWRGRHRLLLCWLIFMHAVSPGRKTLEEMARWTPASITAWRFGRLLKAAYWNVHLIVSGLARIFLATLPTTHPWCAVSVWRWQSRRQTRHQESRGPERAEQPASSVVFWPALRGLDGRMGWLSHAGGLSADFAQASRGLSQRKRAVSRDGRGVCAPVLGEAGHCGRGCRLWLQGQHADGPKPRQGRYRAPMGFCLSPFSFVENGRGENAEKSRDPFAAPVFLNVLRYPEKARARPSNLLDLSHTCVFASCRGSRLDPEQKRAKRRPPQHETAGDQSQPN